MLLTELLGNKTNWRDEREKKNVKQKGLYCVSSQLVCCSKGKSQIFIYLHIFALEVVLQ